jgi:hypothetical protein
MRCAPPGRTSGFTRRIRSPTHPVVAQLIGANWRLSGAFNGSSNVSLGFNNQSEDDPFYKLPILKVLDAVVVRGEMDLALKEITV